MGRNIAARRVGAATESTLQLNPPSRINATGPRHRRVPLSREELDVKNETIVQKLWTKPEFRRLGEIKDVAGAETPLAQGAGNTKS